VSTYLLPIYKLYKYHCVGFSITLHHVANSWESIILNANKYFFNNISTYNFTIFPHIFDRSAHNLHTNTAQNITNQTICIQFNVNTARHVGYTKQLQFALCCTLLFEISKSGLTTVLLDRNTWSLLNTKRCSVWRYCNNLCLGTSVMFLHFPLNILTSPFLHTHPLPPHMICHQA